MRLQNYFIIAFFIVNGFVTKDSIADTLPKDTLFENSDQNFSRQDTLRGTITKEREWWDITYYHLSVKANIGEQSLLGNNVIQYKVLTPYQTLQIELQEPLKITKIVQHGETLKFKKDGYSYFVELTHPQKKGDINELIVYYEGIPVVSPNPPWSGGLTWKKDSRGNPWVVTTCQGSGASLWWPNKDHAYDEPDSMLISITVPNHLMNVSNGRLRDVVKHEDDTQTFNWFVSNPINNYGVNMNIGDYVHFSEKYKGLKGELDCDYYVLRDNLEKARIQFKEVSRMLEAFEYWFGPYPFYEDGYKLVEVPYPGMEHQSSVTYGNGFSNGYGGRDVSGSGWGMKFDFIIIHESGHEWFANNVTYKDIADMWIHESFTSYSENLFVDYHYGKKASSDYVIGIRKNIMNDKPIIGVYNVHQEGSGDMYYKGSNALHTIRQLIDDDEKWRSILVGLNKQFYHQTVNAQQIQNYISEKSGKDLTAFFNQYFRTVKIPKLEYAIEGETLKFRWINVVEGFDMPIQIKINDTEQWIFPNKDWKKITFKSSIKSVVVDVDFYVESNKISEE